MQRLFQSVAKAISRQLVDFWSEKPKSVRAPVRGRAECLDLGSARVPKASELFVDALEATCFERKRATSLFSRAGGQIPKKGLPPLTERGGAAKLRQLIRDLEPGI